MERIGYKEAREIFEYRGGRIYRGGKLVGKEYIDRKSGRIFRRVVYRGKSYMEHHLVWLLEKGIWSSGIINHCDGDSLNNEIGNLEEISRSEKVRRSRIRKDNCSGVSGISWHSRDEVWEVRVDGIYYGREERIEDAKEMLEGIKREGKNINKIKG